VVARKHAFYEYKIIVHRTRLGRFSLFIHWRYIRQVLREKRFMFGSVND
jgi:hypothetical protein